MTNKLKKIQRILAHTFQVILFIVLIFTVLTFLASKIPLFGSIQSMVVLSGSMSPAYPVGSVIYIQKQLGYNLHDAITFKNTAGENVTHRITNIEFDDKGTTYTTKGDANNTVDSVVVPSANVTGRVFLYIPYLGRAIALFGTLQGFIIFIICPSLILIGYELWNIKKEIEKEMEKKVLAKIQQQTISI